MRESSCILCLYGRRQREQRGQHLSRKHFTCVILSLYLYLNIYLVISFFLQMGFSHQKLQNLYAALTSGRKSHSPMLSQILLFKIRICGLWWHPRKSQESTEKWQVTAFRSTYWSQHLNGKILPPDRSLWRYETHHTHKAELRDRCSKGWHHPVRDLSRAETRTSPAARGLFPARAQHVVLWNYHVLCMLVFIRSNTQGSLPSQMLPSFCKWEVLRYVLYWHK